MASLENETIAAALLVSRRETRYGLLGASQLHFNSTGEPDLDCIMVEHNGFVGAHASVPDLWQALVRWFGHGEAGADELLIGGIEKSAAAGLSSPELLQSCRDVPAYRAPLQQLTAKGGFEAGLSRNARQQLRRAQRRYGAWGELKLDEAKTVERALAYFDALKELHIRSWNRRGKPHAFRYEFFETFHRALITRGVPERSVQCLRITAGGRPIGYLYNFRHAGRTYAYQSGFDDEDPALRPGYVCHALAIETAAAEGAHEYDFLAGSNRLKETFGREKYVLSWCTLRQPKLKFRAEAAARAVAKRIARGLR
jgi:CelD/BcsL family acetyltransferase involved in cellulose biosynthesis